MSQFAKMLFATLVFQNIIKKKILHQIISFTLNNWKCASVWSNVCKLDLISHYLLIMVSVLRESVLCDWLFMVWRSWCLLQLIRCHHLSSIFHAVLAILIYFPVRHEAYQIAVNFFLSIFLVSNIPH